LRRSVTFRPAPPRRLAAAPALQEPRTRRLDRRGSEARIQVRRQRGGIPPIGTGARRDAPVASPLTRLSCRKRMTTGPAREAVPL